MTVSLWVASCHVFSLETQMPIFVSSVRIFHLASAALWSTVSVLVVCRWWQFNAFPYLSSNNIQYLTQHPPLESSIGGCCESLMALWNRVEHSRIISAWNNVVQLRSTSDRENNIIPPWAFAGCFWCFSCWGKLESHICDGLNIKFGRAGVKSARIMY